MTKFSFGEALGDENNAYYNTWYNRIASCCETGNYGEARYRLKYLEGVDAEMADAIAHEISVEYNYVLR